MDYIQYIIIALAISLGFFSHALAGFSAALIALPILVQVLPLKESVGLLSFLFFLFSLFFVILNYKKINKQLLIELALGTIIGLFIGNYLLGHFGDQVILKKILGVFILLYVLKTIFKQTSIAFFNKISFLFGLFGGIFSGLFTTGGPFYVTYINNRYKDAKLIRANIIATLGLGDIIRLPIHLHENIINTGTFILTLKILPCFLLAIYLGNKLHHKINDEIYKKVLLGLLMLAAINLLIYN